MDVRKNPVERRCRWCCHQRADVLQHLQLTLDSPPDSDVGCHLDPRHPRL